MTAAAALLTALRFYCSGFRTGSNAQTACAIAPSSTPPRLTLAPVSVAAVRRCYTTRLTQFEERSLLCQALQHFWLNMATLFDCAVRATRFRDARNARTQCVPRMKNNAMPLPYQPCMLL